MTMLVIALITKLMSVCVCFFFSSRRRHTRCSRDWSSDVCSSDLFGGSHGLGFRRGTGRRGSSAVGFVRSEAWPNPSAGTNAFGRPVLFVPTRRNRRETVSRKRIHASFERSRRLPGQSLAQRRRAEDGRLRRRPEPHSWYESLQKGDAKDPGGSSATQDPARHPRPAKGLVLASSRESLLWRHLRGFRRGKSHWSQASPPARSRRRTRRND